MGDVISGFSLDVLCIWMHGLQMHFIVQIIFRIHWIMFIRGHPHEYLTLFVKPLIHGNNILCLCNCLCMLLGIVNFLGAAYAHTLSLRKLLTELIKPAMCSSSSPNSSFDHSYGIRSRTYMAMFYLVLIFIHMHV